MTTKEKLKKMLTDRGMFDKQADAVLEEAIPRIEAVIPDYKYTWDSPADEYPDAAYTVMWLHVSDVAKEWIAKNEPKAWFRSLFE